MITCNVSWHCRSVGPEPSVQKWSLPFFLPPTKSQGDSIHFETLQSVTTKLSGGQQKNMMRGENKLISLRCLHASVPFCLAWTCFRLFNLSAVKRAFGFGYALIYWNAMGYVANLCDICCGMRKISWENNPQKVSKSTTNSLQIFSIFISLKVLSPKTAANILTQHTCAVCGHCMQAAEKTESGQ